MAKQPKPVHHAVDLGLDVLSGEDDMFRWFLLTYLLGKPIQSTVALRTWQGFIDRKLDLPWAIAALPDRQLVGVFHAGGYTRYQNVMTAALKKYMKQLIAGYEGSLFIMLENSENEDEFARHLTKLYGVGPKTAEIFMRETEEYFARRND